jgi:hypothetical protein
MKAELEEEEDFSVSDLQAPRSLEEVADHELQVCIRDEVEIEEIKDREIPKAGYTELEPLECMKLTEKAFNSKEMLIRVHNSNYA